MSGENLACAKQKSRSGPSGWKKYNAWRSETGQRIDPYVRKRPSGSVQPAHNAKRSDSAVAERLTPSEVSAIAEMVAIHAAQPSQESAVDKGVTIHAATPPQESAVAEGVPLHAATPSQGSAVAAEASRRSIGVGEHLSGEAFLWRGIWDMP